MKDFDVIVIGQGYAGLKAAQLAAARGLRTATLEAKFPGGLVMSINDLHPAPASEVPSGPELTGGLAMANMDSGVANIEGAATAICRDARNRWQISTDSGACTASHIIVASGARLRKLGVPGEEEFAGRGVSECADCDGPLYQGKEAVVIGGGDSAFQEAVALTSYASKVTLIMRSATPRARPELVAAVAANARITLLPDTEVKAILGTPASGVTGVSVASAASGSGTIPCSVVFVFVGLAPESAFLPSELTRDAVGAVVTGPDLQTPEAGLWAIGAVRSGFGGLLSDAAADAERVVSAIQ